MRKFCGKFAEISRNLRKFFCNDPLPNDPISFLLNTTLENSHRSGRKKAHEHKLFALVNVQMALGQTAGCPRINWAKKFMCSPRKKSTGNTNFSLPLTGGLSRGCPDFQKVHRVLQGAAQRGAQFYLIFAVLRAFFLCSKMSLFYLKTCTPMKATP